MNAGRDRASESPAPVAAALPRRFGPWTAALAVVGVIVGSGVFRVPPIVAGLLPAPWAILAVWAVGGALTLCLALLLAELGAALPRAGGPYVFLRAAFGDATAFVFGWTFLLVNPASWATLATTFAEFLGYLVPLGDMGRRIVAIGLIVTLAAVNCRSASLGAWLQNAVTSAKVLALLALVIIVFAGGGAAASGVAASAPASISLGASLTALVAVLWAYDGAANFSSLAGEVRDPQRNVPRALVLGVGAVTLLCLVVNVALMYALPVATIAQSPLPLAAAIEPTVGVGGMKLVAAAVVVATAGSLAGLVLSDPRVFYAMAMDGNFLRAVGALHERWRTPVVAIAVHTVLACIYVSTRSFQELAATFILGLVPFYALLAAATWRLRRRAPPAPNVFRAPAVPVLALMWVAAALLLVGNALLESPRIALVNLAITAAGIPLYFLWRRYSGIAQ